jgi:hypothetical protein
MTYDNAKNAGFISRMNGNTKNPWLDRKFFSISAIQVAPFSEKVTSLYWAWMDGWDAAELEYSNYSKESQENEAA